jgi:hypothetical protein
VSEERPEHTPENIAFRGDCELLNASWSLDSGRTIEFRITGQAFDRLHPFKQFTQRRAGRAGTLFQAAVADVKAGGELVYRGDAMLAAWGDSNTLGQHFKLWLDEEADRHPFAGYSRRKAGVPGDLFFVILVEVSDDGTPVDQERRRRAEANQSQGVLQTDQSGTAGAISGGAARGAAKKLSSQAHLTVTSPMFVRYLQETKSHIRKEWTKDLARAYAKHVVGVESLSELDRSGEAAQRYHDQIRRPFLRWQEQAP